MREKTYHIALGGVMASLSLALMSIGSMIPLGTFAVPVAACLCILIIDEELGWKTAILAYFAVAILSLLIAADKEAAAIFIGVTGYYPIVKRILEAKTNKVLAYILKFAIFNLSIGLIYYIILHLFVVASVAEEFAGYTAWMIPVLLVLGNIVFFMVDIVLTRIRIIYRYVWRKKFIR